MAGLDWVLKHSLEEETVSPDSCSHVMSRQDPVWLKRWQSGLPADILSSAHLQPVRDAVDPSSSRTIPNSLESGQAM